MKPVFIATLTAALLLTYSVHGEGALIDVDFSRPGVSVEAKAEGSFSGTLPSGCVENYTHWNTSAVTSCAVREGGREFTRFVVSKADNRVQFQLSSVKLQAPGYYRALVLARCPDAQMEVYIRQLGHPYKEFCHGFLPKDDGWEEREFHFHLERKASPFSDELPDCSNVVLYMALEEGTTDIASIRLFKSDELSFDKAIGAGIKRAEKGMANLFRNSRFPLGAQAGWNASSPNPALLEADASASAPSGAPALKIRTTVFSEPFQVEDPYEENYVRFAYKSEGSWWVSVINGKGDNWKALPPSKDWETILFDFKADPKANAFSLRFNGKGTLWLDSLMAKSGSAPEAYASAGDCEIALAPIEGELSGVRLQFADEAGRIKYHATGDFKGAVLKSKTTDVYGHEQVLPESALDKSPSGEIDFGSVLEGSDLGAFRIEAWAERDGRRISPFNEMVITRIHRPVHWGEDAPDSPFGGHFRPNLETAHMMKAAGINWERLHDSFLAGTCWGWLETEKGKWTFSDESLDAYRKANLKILGFLGSAPIWASWNPGIKHNYIGFTYFYQPRDEAAFRNYVRTVVSRYKGTIDEWQFQNEPWSAPFWHRGYDETTHRFEAGERPAEDYVHWSQIAYEEMKKADPTARMYGFNSHSGPQGRDWTRKVYDAGGYPCCDMIDYHYYNGGQTLDCTPNDAPSEAFANAVGCLEANVPNPLKPVVLSEGNPTRSGRIPADLKGKDDFSGLYKRAIPWDSKDDNVLLSDMTCRYVISHLALGVKRVFLYSDHCYKHLLQPACFPVLLTADGYPHPIMAAFSNMAWLLEGRKFVKRVPVGNDVWAYVFEGRGKSVAVISGKADGRFVLPPADGISAIELFGNPIRGPAEYDGRLFYLVSSQNGLEFATTLAQGE